MTEICGGARAGNWAIDSDRMARAPARIRPSAMTAAKIGLSMKAAQRSQELAEAQGYTAGTSGATLGDVFRNKLKGLTKEE